MKKAERKMNNKGFSLILVIVCMTLIGVLASMILSMSVSNVQMRVDEEKASDNFYSAEEVLDEIRANVEKQANVALGDAYTLFLQKYASTAPKKRESEFVKALSAKLEEKFTQDFTVDEATIRSTYLGVASGDISIGKATAVSVTDDGESSKKVTIKGLSITYKEDGYETTIKTDLVVKVTYPKFFEGNIAGPAFLDYAIITDNNIEKLVGYTGSSINGCVFSGNDLLVSESKLSVNAPFLIAKNAINVSRNSSLHVVGGGTLNYASRKDAGIWTQNILTTPMDRTKASTNSLEVESIDCYVQDDLTINGIADTVTINGGSYFGYGSGMTVEKAETHSAININAKDINLTMSGLNELWLAGQSFISIPKGYGSDELNVFDKPPILQGESVSFKGNQAAYLMPGDSIMGVWHNPMTVDEYNAALQLIQGSTTEKSLVLSTRGAESINGDILNLDQYLDNSSPASKGDYRSRYYTAHIQYKDSTMVYIYMHFSTPNAAKRYFEDYYGINKDLVDTRMETIESGSIVLDINPDKITSTGNLVVHSNKPEDKDNPNTIIYSNTVATDSKMREADYRYSGNFRNLTMSLDAGTVYYGSSDKLTECIFRYESETLLKLQNLVNNEGVKVTYNDILAGSHEYKLYFGNDMTISEETYGLVIATGNVYVNKNFAGLIIAQGTVNVGDNVTIKSAPEAIYALINANEDLKYFFKYFDDPNAGKESKEAIDIYYENWHKN